MEMCGSCDWLRAISATRRCIEINHVIPLGSCFANSPLGNSDAKMYRENGVQMFASQCESQDVTRSVLPQNLSFFLLRRRPT